jgi:hypothetical protein
MRLCEVLGFLVKHYFTQIRIGQVAKDFSKVVVGERAKYFPFEGDIRVHVIDQSEH